MWLIAYASEVTRQWRNSVPLSHSRNKSHSHYGFDASKPLLWISLMTTHGELQYVAAATYCAQREGEPDNIDESPRWWRMATDRKLPRRNHANARVKLSISIIRHDVDAWQPTKRCTDVTAPSTRGKLHCNGRNRCWCELAKEISMNAKTGIIRYWRTYNQSLISASYAKTNLKSM